MKHAGPEALAQLSRLLNRLRQLPGLTERKPGIFYRRASAFLHFHEDAAGLFADVKPGAGGRGFERYPVDTVQQQNELFQRITAQLQASPGHSSE